jgi:hypothetical protein
MKKKKVLLLTPFYFELEQSIVKALESAGLEVILLENKGYFNDPLNIHTPKWESLFCDKSVYIKKNIIPHTHKYYDFFFCVNLFSFDSSITENLKKRNPDIKSILYLWDNIKFFKWNQFFKYFTKVYTFDLYESKKHDLNYLPNFYTEMPNGSAIVYDFSAVGSCQINRYFLLDHLIQKLKQQDLKYYFYLYYDVNARRFSDFIKYNFIGYLFANCFPAKYLSYKTIYKLNQKPINEICKYEKIPKQAAISMMQQTNCIIDLALVGQTGSTHRLIQALALQKKVITNNISVMDEPFYNPEYIQIIKSNDIQIDHSWLNNKPKNKIDMSYLHINAWINTIFNTI